MKWRAAVIALLALAATLPSAFAQQSGKAYRISVISATPAAQLAGPTPANPAIGAFVQGMKARGYIEGHNLNLDRWSLYQLDSAGIDDMMARMVRSKPDLIVVPGTSFAVRAIKLTNSIPIVMAASVDPVGAGLAQSLARPGGNVTGLTTDVGAGAESKRLELLLELLPMARRIAFVGTKGDWDNDWGKGVQSVAAKRRVGLFFAEGTLAGFGEALAAVRREKSEAVFVALSPLTFASRSDFGEFTVASRIPSSCPITEIIEQGCLMAYGQSVAGIWTQAVAYVDKILKGAKPGDLPIEQPTRFELAINLKTAKAIGIKVPHSLLIRADRVIE